MQAISDIGLVDVTPNDDQLLQRKHRHHHRHGYYDPLNMAQLTSFDSKNTTHAILYKGTVKIVPDHEVNNLDHNQLTKPYIFAILSLDKEDDKGTFKQKTYNRTSLQEMYQTFDDVTQIRKDPFVVLIGNGKLIKHTGSIESEEIQAIIGRAIQKKFLTFKTANSNEKESQEELAQKQTKSKSKTL